MTRFTFRKAWSSLSSAATSRSADLIRLHEAGYEVSIRKGHLILSDVPYRTASGTVERGIITCALQTVDGITVQPDNHQVYLQGSMPHDENGQSLEVKIVAEVRTHELLPGLAVDFHLSHKPEENGTPRNYHDYFEKFSWYAEILERGARSIDPDATAKTHATDGINHDYSVFHYPDTASARAGITDINEKLVLGRVAIVGLGGTGSYILDSIAKTPVGEIHLFDGDILEDHNAFRAPGAVSREDLAAHQTKVNYFKSMYSRMRDGIEAHEVFVDGSNTELLADMDYVFLAMDGGPDEKDVATKLISWEIPFASVGMGVSRGDDGLTGMLRTTSSSPDAPADPERLGATAEADPDDEYASNIQIAELNMWNAVQAVVKWKKHFGFYADETGEGRSLVVIQKNKVFNKVFGA